MASIRASMTPAVVGRRGDRVQAVAQPRRLPAQPLGDHARRRSATDRANPGAPRCGSRRATSRGRRAATRSARAASRAAARAPGRGAPRGPASASAAPGDGCARARRAALRARRSAPRRRARRSSARRARAGARAPARSGAAPGCGAKACSVLRRRRRLTRNSCRASAPSPAADARERRRRVFEDAQRHQASAFLGRSRQLFGLETGHRGSLSASGAAATA